MNNDTIIRALCWTLLHSLWQGLLLAGVAGVVLVLTRKSAAALRYNLLCGGLFLFLLVSGYTFYRELGVDGVKEPAVSAAVDKGEVGRVVTGVGGVEATRNIGSGVAAGVDALVGYFNSHAALVVLVWAIVFLARWVQLLSGWVFAQRIRHYKNRPAPEGWQRRLGELLAKLRISRPVSLLESALVKVPVVVGALKPVILVPMGMLANLPAEQVESILLHELAHIRRRDYLFNFIQQVVDTLFFFNPALRWISSLVRAERENCCDDIAIRETGSRRRLIEALVSFHEYGQSSGGYALGFAARENQVVRRVKRIVDRTNHSLNAGEKVLLMGGLVVLSAAFVTIKGSRGDVKAPAKLALRDAGNTVVREVADGVEKKTVATAVVQVAAEPRVGVQGAVLKHSDAASADEGRRMVVDTVPKDTVVAGEDPFRNISVDKLIECRDHGVTAEFIAGFRRMGYKHITIDKAIELADHGVSTDFIAGIIAEGYTPPISLDLALELKDHGVSVGFLRDLHALGFPTIMLDKAIELVDHGVTIGFINSWKKKIGKLLDLDDYIKLRDAGISPTS